MDPQIPQPGELVGDRLRVEKVLGTGGMGVVLAARHVELGELVAVKMLRLPDANGNAFERLRREARAAAKLRGEHVVRVIDVGTLDSGAPFIVMEYVAGQTVAQAREALGRLPVSTAVDWVLQACEGLAEAHGLGIVHRDVKPSNLLLTTRPDGSQLVKLLDFGIAKSGAVPSGTLTETGGFLGSPLYASPEQVRDAKVVDHRTDIWSMGVVLYQLVTGQLPFPSYTATAALASLVADPPIPPRSIVPELPMELERALLRCLEKDPRNRFASVAELSRALEPFGSEEAQGATARVGRILNQAGKLPTEAAPGNETLSTKPPSQDGALASSRTASQSALHRPGAVRETTRPKAWWVLAAVAIAALGLGMWARRPSGALAGDHPVPVAVAPPATAEAASLGPLAAPAVAATPPADAPTSEPSSPPVSITATPRSAGARAIPTAASRAPSLRPAPPTTRAPLATEEDDFGPRK